MSFFYICMTTYEILCIDNNSDVYLDYISTDLDLSILNLKIWVVLPLDSNFPVRTIQNISKL